MRERRAIPTSHGLRSRLAHGVYIHARLSIYITIAACQLIYIGNSILVMYGI